MKKNAILILLITLIGGFLRFYLLGDVPGTLHRDEAFWGYNTLSVLKTAHDMTGDFLPLHLKSFLFSPSLYIYFSIPFVWIFGLSDMSIRLASALFGTLTMPALYFFVVTLFKKNSQRYIFGLMSAFILAVMPWHINLSRVATENTIVTFLIVVATTFFLISRIKNSLGYVILSYFFFFISLFVYQMPRSFLPFYIPLLYICFAKERILSKKIIPHVFIFFLFILIPLFIVMGSQELSLRIRTVSIFGTPENVLKIEEQRRNEYLQGKNPLISKMFHNKAVYYTKTAAENYFSHFTYEFIFTDKGLPDRYRIPLSPLIFIVLLPMLLYGVYSCLNMKQQGVYIISTILLIPLGSALTFDDIPNLQRTMPLTVFFSIVIGIGALKLLSLIPLNKRLLLLFLFMAFFVFEFLLYLRQYYFHSSLYRPWYRNDGYKELVNELRKFPDTKTVITNRESAPAIFFLFYNSYDPAKYQEISKKSTSIHYDMLNFDRFEFSEDECPLKIENSNAKSINANGGKLYVNSSLCKIEKGSRLIKTIKRTDGSDVFHIVKLAE